MTETGPPFHAINRSNTVADILDMLLEATHNSRIVKTGCTVEATFFAIDQQTKAPSNEPTIFSAPDWGSL